MGECWAQHWGKVQYNDEARYVPRRGVIDGIWSSLYTSVIADAGSMYDLAEAEGNLNHLARESNSSDWQGTITQGMAIIGALKAVQKANEKRRK